MQDVIVNKFLEKISKLRNEIQTIYLFGSRARGDERPDSDYDFLIVVKRPHKEFRKEIYNAVVDVLLENNKLVSLKIVKGKDFVRLSQMGLPFIKNVLKEGMKIG
jgi:predicted nucleotidyltransferase